MSHVLVLVFCITCVSASVLIVKNVDVLFVTFCNIALHITCVSVSGSLCPFVQSTRTRAVKQNTLFSNMKKGKSFIFFNCNVYCG